MLLPIAACLPGKCFCFKQLSYCDVIWTPVGTAAQAQLLRKETPFNSINSKIYDESVKLQGPRLRCPLCRGGRGLYQLGEAYLQQVCCCCILRDAKVHVLQVALAHCVHHTCGNMQQRAQSVFAESRDSTKVSKRHAGAVSLRTPACKTHLLLWHLLKHDIPCRMPATWQATANLQHNGMLQDTCWTDNTLQEHEAMLNSSLQDSANLLHHAAHLAPPTSAALMPPHHPPGA
jgi:hypothetical protein